MTSDQPRSARSSVIALITDMIFASKVRGTGDQIAVPVIVCGSVESFRAALDNCEPTLAIVDMAASASAAPEAIRLAKSATSVPHVIAYCSHVDVDAARLAESSGADACWPRSRFSKELAALLERFSNRDRAP